MNKLILILASLMYHEGRSESYIGLHMIADTMWNRAQGKPDALISVVTKPSAYDGMAKVNIDSPDIPEQNNDEERDLWLYCVELASDMVYGKFTPNTHATHFWRVDCEKKGWMLRMKIVTQYRNHTYARER